MIFKPVIGLEVHIELRTKSKMFCGCSADYFGKEPNTHVCPVCLGLPGALPVPNKKAIEWCVMIGLALNCKIPLFSKFDRKNYFYPDLPKGYQISQYDQPFARNGPLKLKIKNEKLKIEKEKMIRIRRVHMEEDTAKLVHQFGNQKSIPDSIGDKNQKDGGYTLIDFNRSGIPLVEIVTDPDFESAEQVLEYLKKLQQIVRYLDVSDADMEKGEMRFEPNISLSPSPQPSPLEGEGKGEGTNELPKYKVEIKNINSFRFVDRAINYEIERQRKILESGKTPVQETRGWDEKKQITVSQRVKEEAMDYRYFPEADIPPIRWAEYQISNIKYQIGELPDQKIDRFQKEYGLSDYDSEILTRERTIADYFEEAVKINQKSTLRQSLGQEINSAKPNQKYTEIKTIANWIINKKLDPEKVLPAELIRKILDSKKIEAIDTKELEAVIEKTIKANPKAVTDFKKGKKNVIMFLIGQVMKRFSKRLDPKIVKESIEKMLQ